MLRFLTHCALLCTLAVLVGCGTPHATMKNVTGQDVMLLGHDPVAYFTKAQSVRGNPVFQTTLPGRTYYFTSAEHKKLFDAAPDKYEPQYAGFCASGASYALKLGSDPTEWRVVDGKLYIFGGAGSRDGFLLDVPANIALANKYWKEEVAGNNSFWQRTKRLTFRVPHYKSGKDLADLVAAKKAKG